MTTLKSRMEGNYNKKTPLKYLAKLLKLLEFLLLLQRVVEEEEFIFFFINIKFIIRYLFYK